MTKKELSQLNYLNAEIWKLKGRLAQMRAASTNTVAHISGLPHVRCVTDKTAIAVDIIYLSEKIECMISESIKEYDRLMRYINSVDDSLMRQILTHRFVDGLNYYQVAMHMGGGNTEDSVKKACYRFLENSDNVEGCPDCPD